MRHAFARGALRRRVHRDARGLAPSIELPWTPPWTEALGDEIVDVVADVHVLQADVAGAAAWDDDASGARRRARIVDACTALAERAEAQSFRATAHALREIAASVRAWEALAPHD